MKCLTDTVDSARSVAVDPERVNVVTPGDFTRPEGLHIAWQNYPLAVEKRLYQQRLPAVQAFVRANGLDRTVFAGPRRRLGIVTTGKAHFDVLQALAELGIDEARARELGLSIYKVAMTWPLEPVGARRFAEGLEERARRRGEAAARRGAARAPALQLAGAAAARGEDGRARRAARAGRRRAQPAGRRAGAARLARSAAFPSSRRASPCAARRSFRRPPRAGSRGFRASAPAVRTTRRRWCPRAASRSAGSGVTAWRCGCRSAARWP